MSRPAKSHVLANHTAYVQADGTMAAAGLNNYGQLGIGSTSGQNTAVAISSQPAGKKALIVATGQFQTAVIMNDGTLYACGQNSNGECGLGATTQFNNLTLVNVGSDSIRDIAFGSIHAAAITVRGGLLTTGSGADGRLGAGASRNVFQQVPNLPPMHAVACGVDYTLALSRDGAVYACGANTYGQLGDGTTTSRSTPIQVLTGVTSIICGEYTSFAVMNDGTLKAWGYNGAGKSLTGTGSTDTNVLTPTTVTLPVGKTLKTIATAQTAAIVLFTDNTVYGWGTNTNNVLGGLTLNAHYTTPTALSIWSGATPTVNNIVSASYMTHVFYTESSQNKVGYLGYFQNGAAGNGSATATATTVTAITSWTTLGSGVRTSAIRTTPDAPTISPAPLVEPATATYYWLDGPNANIVSYMIILMPLGSSTAIRNFSPVNTYETTFSGLTDGVDYECYMYSVSSDDMSDPAYFRTIQTSTTPAAPPNVVANREGDYKLSLSWDLPAGPVKWILLFTEPDEVTGAYTLAFPFEGYKTTSITPDFPTGTYNLFLKAINDAGHGEPTPIGTYTFPPPV